MTLACPHSKGRLSRATVRYHQLLTRLMKGIEVTFAKSILAEKKRTVAAYIKYFLGTRSLHAPHLEQEHHARMVEIYGKVIKQTIRTFSTIASERRAKAGKADRFAHLEMVWNTRHGAQKITKVSQTTIKDIQAALMRSAEEQETVVQTVSRIRGVSVLSAFRARVIAQTEVHSAAIFAGIETDRMEAKETGLQIEKAWVSVEDEVTRPAHIEMDPDEFIPDDSPFIVDGEALDYPGDPSGSPENIINCRCVLVTQEAPTDV